MLKQSLKVYHTIPVMRFLNSNGSHTAVADGLPSEFMPNWQISGVRRSDQQGSDLSCARTHVATEGFQLAPHPCRQHLRCTAL
jgi:hypothetical protein